MEEPIIVDCRKHWFSFVIPTILVVGLVSYGLYVLFESYNDNWTCLLFWALAALIAVRAIISYNSNYLQITRSWVIGKNSLLTTQQQVAPIDKVAVVTISNGFIGSLLGYSNIVVSTSGSRWGTFVYRRMTNGELLQEKFMEVKKAADTKKTGYHEPETTSTTERYRGASSGRSASSTVDSRASTGGWKTPGGL